MMPIFILLISGLLFAQFGLFYWRALVAGVAASPVPLQLREAAGLATQTVGQPEYGLMLDLDSICPDLQETGRATSGVRIYSRAVAALGRMAGRIAPVLSAWADRETVTCARYLAVVVGQRLEGNRACMARVSAF